MTEITINETELYEIFNNKINKTLENINKIKELTSLTDNNKNKDYIEKLNDFSNCLNNLQAKSQDLLDEYLMTTNYDGLTQEEKQYIKTLRINKRIQNMFLPYMLYLQVILDNKTE